MSAKFDRDYKIELDFKKKIKTELCKNWELTGICPFKDKVFIFIKCSFAHGV